MKISPATKNKIKDLPGSISMPGGTGGQFSARVILVWLEFV
jgi:hypothetical protein